MTKMKSMQLKFNPQKILSIVFTLALAAAFIGVTFFLMSKWNENKVLRQVIKRLSADSRVAEVLVTNTSYDEKDKQILTTIKFLEFDANGKPLKPKFFTFKGNVIQFQSLVIRFNDTLIERGDKLKGKSAFIFLKAFVLENPETQVMTITPAYEIPEGYKIPGSANTFEKQLWEKFWKYALDPVSRDEEGIKSAQIEAPGSVFVPGTIYTLKIEHDGGLRIDSEKIPEILKGEKI